MIITTPEHQYTLNHKGETAEIHSKYIHASNNIKYRIDGNSIYVKKVNPVVLETFPPMEMPKNITEYTYDCKPLKVIDTTHECFIVTEDGVYLLSQPNDKIADLAGVESVFWCCNRLMMLANNSIYCRLIEHYADETKPMEQLFPVDDIVHVNPYIGFCSFITSTGDNYFLGWFNDVEYKTPTLMPEYKDVIVLKEQYGTLTVKDGKVHFNDEHKLVDEDIVNAKSLCHQCFLLYSKTNLYFMESYPSAEIVDLQIETHPAIRTKSARKV